MLSSLTSLTTVLCLLTPFVNANADANAGERPSFVFILSESLDGRLLRPDSLAKIPNIRALLAGGSVRFDTAYANSPVCGPSRSSMHSGRAPHKISHAHNGMTVDGVWNNYEGLPSNYSTRLDQLLNASGYATGVFGKTDWTIGGHSIDDRLESLTFNVLWPYNISENGGWNQEPGADMCASIGPVFKGGSAGPTGSPFFDDWRIVNQSITYITAAAAAPQPYFAFIGLEDILHPAYRTTEFWYDRASNETTVPVWPPLDQLHPCDLQTVMKRGCSPGANNASAYAAFYDPARIAHVRRVYLAEVEEFDAMVGSVVDALKASHQWNNNTFIILAADHGDMQLEHQMFYKMVPYDGSARIPLIIASPALAGLGEKTITQPTQLLDIFPTVLGLAGVQVPTYADGYDLSPFFNEGVEADADRPPFVVLQLAEADLSMSWAAIVNGTHKLVQYGTGAEVPPQLFNLDDDPGEAVNLVNSSDAARAAVAALDSALRSVVDYPAVAHDIAEYQLAQFRFYTNSTKNWRTVIASPQMRWFEAFNAHSELAIAAIEAYINQTGPAVIVPCDGRLASNLGTTAV
jgi:arylsulfatase A-like enzyme